MTETPPPNRGPWKVAIFLGVVGALNYADRSAFAAVLGPIKAELHLSNSTLGVLTSLFLWAYAVGSPCAGVLGDRISRSLLCAISLAIWSFFMGLTGFATGLGLLYVCRFGLGLGESPFHPAAFALVADHHTPANRARAMSILSMGFQFGIMAGGATAGFLAERFGWRMGFWVLGGIGVALALASRAFLSDAPRPKRSAPAEAAPVGQALAYLIRNPSYLLLVLKQILAEASTWIFTFWLPLYLLETFSLKLGAAGFLGTVVISVPMVLGIMAGGWMSDALARRHGKYRLLALGGCYLVAGPILVVFLLRPTLVTVLVAVAAWTLLRGMGGASERPSTCEVVPNRYRATAFGIMNTFATLSGALGSLLAGLLKDNIGLNAVFAGSSVLFIITGVSLIIGTFACMPRDMEKARALES